jgi:hypothetical protein
MVKRKPERDNLLTVMARSVGSALGTVTSRVANLGGSNSAEGSSNPKPKNRKAQADSGSQGTPQPRRQSKRTEAKRKPKTKKVAKKSRSR